MSSNCICLLRQLFFFISSKNKQDNRLELHFAENNWLLHLLKVSLAFQDILELEPIMEPVDTSYGVLDLGATLFATAIVLLGVANAVFGLSTH